MNLQQVFEFRRSVRVYDKEKPIDPEKVRHCIELATLAPQQFQYATMGVLPYYGPCPYGYPIKGLP